jgi:hypothetical protein
MVGSGRPRLSFDHYETIDPRLVEQLGRHFRLKGTRVWEPACGRTGYLVQALRKAGAAVVAFGDIQTGQDFFALRPAPEARIEVIITNPPFSQISEFIAHALAVLPGGWVVMLARWDWLGSIGSRSGKREWVEEHPRFYAMTLPMFRPWWSHEHAETPRHAFTWLVWQPAFHVGWVEGEARLWRK